MFQLFNYATLKTRLDKTTRTLHITLSRGADGNPVHPEMLFELESLLAWCVSRVEISSLHIHSDSARFSRGADPAALSRMAAPQLEKLQQRLQKVVWAMMQVPQTVVMDLGEGAANWAMELALGADVRLCATTAELKFDHARLGLLPASGGMALLAHQVSPAHARQWTSLGTAIPLAQLSASGFIHATYPASTKEETVRKTLEGVHAQAPVQRIQAKLGVFEAQRESLERALDGDRKIAKAALVAEDWKARAESAAETDNVTPFMPAKSLGYAVKLTLVPDQAQAGAETEH